MNSARRSLLPLAALLGLASASAQTDTNPATGGSVYFAPTPQLEITKTVTVTPAREPVRLWGGVGTEVYVLPSAHLGVSVPIGQVGGVNLALRGLVDATVVPLPDAPSVLPLVSVDGLVVSRGPGVKVYGGPSVGTVLGFAWLVGGVAGVQNDFGSSRWGWHAEARARWLLAGGTDSSVTLFTPGLRLGLTYRF